MYFLEVFDYFDGILQRNDCTHPAYVTMHYYNNGKAMLGMSDKAINQGIDRLE